MTNFLDEFEAQLISAVERDREQRASLRGDEPAGGGRWRQMLRRRPLIVFVVAILIGGTATAAVVTLGASRPLKGTVGLVVPGASPGTQARYRISAFPYMAVGWAGWCTSAVFDVRHGQSVSDSGCFPTEVSNGPVIAGEGFDRYYYGIDTSSVAAVRFAFGETVRTISDRRLPSWMRGYFVIAPSLSTHAVNMTLLDAAGRTVPDPLITAAQRVQHLPLTRVDPRDPGTTPCAMRANPTSQVRPIAETVAIPVPWPRHQLGDLESCSNATFRVGPATLAAAVLVNATNPGQSAPPLPGLTAQPGHPAILAGGDLGTIGFPEGASVGNATSGDAFELSRATGVNFGAPAGVLALTNQNISARRVGGDWLIAEGGTANQRDTLLQALTLTGRR
jgi:hypothetical protein